MLYVEVMGSIEKQLSGPLELEYAFNDKPMQQKSHSSHGCLSMKVADQCLNEKVCSGSVDNVRKTKTKNMGSSLGCGMCVCRILRNICIQTVPK